MRKIILLALILFSSGAAAVSAQSSGGVYTMTSSVVSSGGGAMQGSGAIKVDSTAAQPGAGEPMAASPYSMSNGFWNPLFAPTAAGVEIGGGITSPNGTPVKHVVVTLTGGTFTAPRVSRTNGFGFFTFENVEVGHVYVVTVAHKRYAFANPTQTFILNENLTGLDFQTTSENW